MLAPPGFLVPNRAPPPGFSSQERYEQGLRSTPLPSRFELHSPRSAGEVEFMDPAILAVGKGILPLEVNNSGLGLNSIIPPQFCTTEGRRMQSLMQHPIAAHQDRRFFNNDNMHDAYSSSRFPMQINNTSYSPFTHRQVRTSNVSNSQWTDRQNMLNDSGMGMAEMFKNERFGHDNFVPMEELKFRLSSSNYLYTKPYGM